MLNGFGYEVGRWDLARYRERVPRETFTVMEREWILLPEVWPGNALATRLFSSWLPFEETDSFLEVGCGTGVTAVVAALRGCARVCALDISPAAAENTRLNAMRHGVHDRVTALTSDLFTELDPSDRFDMIYWNSPYAEAPPGHHYESGLDYAVFDADYAMHRAYFAGARRHLRTGGRLFLGFSDTLGNRARLTEAAKRAGFQETVFRRETVGVRIDLPDERLSTEVAPGARDVDVEYVLYEFHPA